MAELPLTPFKRIVKKFGGVRVSADAAEALREEIEDYSLNLAKAAANLAEHAGRKTVTAKDIKMASK